MSIDAMGRIRLIIAMLLSPIVAAAIAAIVIGILVGGVDAVSSCYDPPYEHPCGAADFADMLHFTGVASVLGGMLGAIIGWPTMLIGGLPAHAYLTRSDHTQSWIYVVLGLVIGSLAMMVYFAIVGDLIDLLTGEGGWLALSGPLSGALTAGLFWLIRRPDQMSPA